MPASTSPTILVIDDNPAVATALEVLFSLHDIAHARGDLAAGRPGAARARADRPGGAGHELPAPTPPRARKAWRCSRAIRARHPDLPVILLTAWTQLESAVDLVKAGAADYLAKPWDDRKLLATVNNLLELSEARRELARHRKRRAAPPQRAGTRLRPARLGVRRCRQRTRAGARLPGRALRTAGAGHRAQRRRQGEDRRDRACQLGGEGRAVRRAQLRRAAVAS